MTKKELDGEHPPSHYLVVEDPKHPGTWHLRVRDADGSVNHNLMGAAWAALHGGYRGNKYEGPGKETAIARLKALYRSEGMDLPDSASSDGQSDLWSDLNRTIAPQKSGMAICRLAYPPICPGLLFS